MYPLYKAFLNSEGSYDFTTDNNQLYTVYFLEYTLPDADGNLHLVYNFGFTRNRHHITEKYFYDYDIKIRNTIVSIVNDFFIKNEDKTLLYFCYSDDGFGRHRSITFRQWCKVLDTDIIAHHKTIKLTGKLIYSTCLITKDNALRKLITDAFDVNMEDLAKLNS